MEEIEPTATREDKRAQKQAQEAELAQARIAKAKERAERAAHLAAVGGRGKRALVAVSGGKDSLVTLDVMCSVFDHVEGFYLGIVLGLETFEAPVDAAARRHGITIHKLPHFELPRLIKYAVLRPHVPNAAAIKELRWADMYRLMRQRTGIEWFAAGERGSDSLQRRLYTRVGDGVQPNYKRVFPIYDWVDADVYGYLRARKIPMPTIVGYSGQRGSGFSLDGRGLSWLKQANPADYKRVLKVFPYAEAEVIRFQRRQEEERRAGELAAARGEDADGGAEQVSKVPAGAGGKKRAKKRAV